MRLSHRPCRHRQDRQVRRAMCRPPIWAYCPQPRWEGLMRLSWNFLRGVPAILGSSANCLRACAWIRTGWFLGLPQGRATMSCKSLFFVPQGTADLLVAGHCECSAMQGSGPDPGPRPTFGPRTTIRARPTFRPRHGPRSSSNQIRWRKSRMDRSMSSGSRQKISSCWTCKFKRRHRLERKSPRPAPIRKLKPIRS